MTLQRRTPVFSASHASATTCWLAAALLGIFLLASGCREHGTSHRTLLEDLHSQCFARSVDCEQLELDALLYLDTDNLPSSNSNKPFLILSSLVTTPISHGDDRLAFSFDESEQLPSEIDPGLDHQLGWKVRLTSARLRYCDTCYTNTGLAEVIDAYGSLANAEFVYDPADTLDNYVKTRMIP